MSHPTVDKLKALRDGIADRKAFGWKDAVALIDAVTEGETEPVKPETPAPPSIDPHAGDANPPATTKDQVIPGE